MSHSFIILNSCIPFNSFLQFLTAQLGLFDPCNVLEEADDEFFNTLRTIELKHGRMAMLAVPGYLATYAGMRLPGLEGVPSGMDAWSNLPATVLYQMGATLMLMEIVNSDIAGKSEFPGDYRNGALDFGWDKLDDATKMKKRSIELNNGRAAQMGILGLITHEYMGNIGDILP